MAFDIRAVILMPGALFALAGTAIAADAGSGTRNWGGVWLGFGAGYSASTIRGTGAERTDACLTSTYATGTSSGSVSCSASTSDGISRGLISTSAQATSDEGDASASSWSGVYVFAVDDVAGGSIGLGPPDTDPFSSGIVIDPAHTLYMGISSRAGTDPQGNPRSDFTYTEVFPTPESRGPLNTNGFGGTLDHVSVVVAQVSPADPFNYAAVSYSSARSEDSFAEALAIALSNVPSFGSSDTSGDFAPDVHLRFDYQTESNIILGAELSVSMAGASGQVQSTTRYPLVNTDDELSVNRAVETDTNALASARLRLGYAVGDYMVYGTGGLAYTNFEATATSAATYNGKSVLGSSSQSENAFGGVIGGGISTFVTDNATLSLEGLYYRFDKDLDFDIDGQEMTATLDDAFSVMMKFSIRVN